MKGFLSRDPFPGWKFNEKYLLSFLRLEKKIISRFYKLIKRIKCNDFMMIRFFLFQSTQLFKKMEKFKVNDLNFNISHQIFAYIWIHKINKKLK